MKISKGWIVAIACWAILLASSFLTQHLSNVEKIPLRKTFQDFPYRVGEDWIGKGQQYSNFLAGVLGADAYFLRNYHDDKGNRVELFFAYFEYTGSMRSPHAPQLCWLGSGWAFKDLGVDTLALKSKRMPYVTVKEMLVERGGTKLLMFYCYKLNNNYFTDFGTYRINSLLDTLLKRKNCAFSLQLTSEVGEDYSRIEGLMKDFLSNTLTMLEDDFLP
jgi:EpsI family protein